MEVSVNRPPVYSRAESTPLPSEAVREGLSEQSVNFSINQHFQRYAAGTHWKNLEQLCRHQVPTELASTFEAISADSFGTCPHRPIRKAARAGLPGGSPLLERVATKRWRRQYMCTITSRAFRAHEELPTACQELREQAAVRKPKKTGRRSRDLQQLTEDRGTQQEPISESTRELRSLPLTWRQRPSSRCGTKLNGDSIRQLANAFCYEHERSKAKK